MPSDEEIRERIGEHCPMPHMHMSVMEQECPFCSAWTELGCSIRDATLDAALETVTNLAADLKLEKTKRQREILRDMPEEFRLWMLEVVSCDETLGEDGLCDCAREHFDQVVAARDAALEEARHAIRHCPRACENAIRALEEKP